MTDLASPMPEAPILAIRLTDTTRIVTVRCAYCEREHRHGWPLDSTTPGIRWAHCARGGLYRLVLTELGEQA